jgi:O-antigen/teichoic acid export membrane protein
MSGKLQNLARTYLQSKIARSATWMLHGQGIQLAAQFAYFVLVAHVLGPAGFGTFVACTAAVNVLAPFSSWGSAQMVMKYVSRDRSVLPVYFGNAILISVASGLVWTILLLLARPLLLPPSVTPWMLIAVAITDLICTQLSPVCSQAFLAIDQPRKAANVLIMAAVTRLLAALLLLTSVASPGRWSQLYLAAAAITIVYQIFELSRATSIPRIQLSLILPSLREGFHFATSQSAQTVYDNIDKSMLARMSSVEAAAIYAVAYRFVDAAMLPVRALAAATYGEFFRRGENGVTATFAFARRILRRSVLYGLLTTLLLFAASSLLPLVMGKGYVLSAAALRLLCPLPLIKSVHSFLTDTLTGANYQWERSTLQIGVAAFNFLINLWLIRVYAWRGASWSSVVTDSLLLLSLYLLIRWHLRREQSATRPAVELS